MSSKALLFAAVVLSVSAPAFADSGVEFVNNEAGLQTTHVTPSKTTRAEREVIHQSYGAPGRSSPVLR